MTIEAKLEDLRKGEGEVEVVINNSKMSFRSTRLFGFIHSVSMHRDMCEGPAAMRLY